MKFLSDILAKAGLTVDGVVTLNNTATGQTPDANDNSTKLATTAWVRTFVQPYSLPIASASVLGGVKVGSGLSINSTTGVLSVTGASAASIKSTQTFVVTEGQTVFTVTGGYTPGLIDIFLNGVYLSPNQTVATNGTTFTINDPAATGDIVDIIVSSAIFEGSAATTDQLPEGVVNLYYTDARARAAISLTTNGSSGVATYIAGVLNIPNYRGLVPAGGNAGQILSKVDGTDYNTQWLNEAPASSYTSQLKHVVKAGVAINKGQAVYVTSADGTNMIVGKASNASEQTSSKTLGLLESTASANGFANVITEGLLAGLDTTGANAAGDPVWLGTDGNLIYGLVNKPSAPAHLVFIGIVTRKNANNGEIFVKVQNGFEMKELHDYVESGVQNNFVISYESSTDLYKPKSIATLLGYTPANAARTLTINGTSYDLTADRTWNVGTVTSVAALTIGNTGTDITSTVANSTTTPVITLNIPDASAFARGVITTGIQTIAGGKYFSDNIAVGHTSPFDVSQFSLDVNGGLLVKNSSKTAQFVLINSNPALGGNNAFVVHTVGGSLGTSYADIQGYYGTSIAGSTVLRLNPQGGNVLIGNLAGTGNRMVVASATGVLSTQAIQTLSDLSGVPTARTLTINGVTFDLSANRSWTINSMVYPSAGIAVSTGTAWGTSITDNSSNWNTAFGWGNHASAGYATTTYVNTQVANLVASAPATLDTLNELAAALGNDAAFSTTVTTALGNRLRIDTASQGLTSTQQGNGRTNLGLGSLAVLSSVGNAQITDVAWSKVTGAPAFITGYTEVDTLASVTGRGATTTSEVSFNAVATTNGTGDWTNASTYTYKINPSSSYWRIAHLSAHSTVSGVYTYQTGKSVYWGEDSDTGDYSFRGRTLKSGSNTVWHAGNLTNLNQLTNGPGYITSYTETDTLASVTARGASTSTNSIFSGGLQSRKNQTDNNYTTAALWTESFGNTTTGIAFHISGNVGKFLEMRTNGILYWENNQVVTNTGTWGINVTGTAGSISGFNNPTTGATANTIAYRDSGGDLYARYMFAVHFNQSGGNSENPTIGQIWTQNTTDNYVRKSTPAHFISQLALITASNYSSYSLPLSGGIMTGALVNNTDGAVIIESNTSENNNWLWKEAAKQWGLFWFNRGSQSGQTIGTYTTVGAELMFMGGSSGIAMPTGWTGYIAGSNIAAMISNWNGYIYSASTVFAATSMVVGGNIVWHAGNDGSGSGLDSDTVDGVQLDNIVWGNARGTNDSVTTDNDNLDKTGYYTSSAFTNRPSGVANWMYIEHIKLYNNNTAYQKQIGYDTYDDRMWVRTENSGAWTSWKQIWTSSSLTNLNQLSNGPGYITGYTETDTLASVTGRGASTASQVSFTKTDDHAISVGTIRGRAVGSQTGEFIQLYERVNIGGPNGWGAANTAAPQYGLSVFGAANIGYGNSGGITVSGTSTLNGQVNINRHIDANTGWGSASGNTIFVGWSGGKVVLGNGNSGGHDYARDITEQSIVSTNQHYFFTTANFNSNININGGINQNNIVGRPYAVWGAAPNATGAVIIKFPGGTGNYGMVHAVIDIYEYDGNDVCTIIVGGHNWGSAWYNFGAQVIGSTNKSVRVGVKDGRYCIVIGNGSSSWSYGQVVLRKIQNGTYYSGAMSVNAGYSVAIESDSYSWISGDLRNLETPSNFYAGGSIYAGGNIVATQSWVSGTTVANANALGGLALGNSTSSVAFWDSSRNLYVNNPESYSGEVRLGAAWGRGGVYASNTLSLSTSGSSEIHYVFGNTVPAKMNSGGGIYWGPAVSYSSFIRPQAHPDQGYTGSALYWVEIGSYGGTHVVLNMDGSAGSGENGFDHFTIWQTASNSSSGSRQFYVTNIGNVWARNDITAFSDIIVKENIRPIEKALEKVVKSRGVIYDRIDTGEKNGIGFIAQELELQLPDLVKTDDKGLKSVKYQNMVAVLTEAIKEQQTQIESQKTEIEELKDLVKQLINR